MRRNWASWLIALSVIGYPPIGVAGSLMGTSLAIPLRLLLVALSLGLIVTGLPRVATLRTAPLLALLGVYLVRLYWDLTFGAPGDAEAALLFYASSVFLPALAVATLRPGDVDWELTAKRMVVLGLLTTIGLLAASEFSLDEVALYTHRLETERLNTISVANASATTILAALCLLTKRHPWRNLVLLAVAGTAVYSLIFSAARGPLLALAATVVVYIAFSRRVLAPAILCAGAAYLFLQEDSLIAARFEAIAYGLFDESLLVRNEVQAAAWQQFNDAVIFGSGFVERSSLNYPHNLELDVLMSTGMVGGFLLCIVLLQVTLYGWRMLRARMLLLPLLALHHLLGHQTSGTLWNADALIVLMAAVLATSPYKSAHAPRPAQAIPA